MLKYNGIKFDDYTIWNDNEDTCWVYMCPYCLRKYSDILPPPPHDEAPIDATCGVYECNNKAEVYVDLPKNEVEIDDPGGYPFKYI